MHGAAGRRKLVAACVAGALFGSILATATVTPSGAQAVTSAAPAPTPAKAGKPTSVAAIGDSISQSTGTGGLSQENPENSWATGWSINSVAARIGIPTNKRFNYSANGHRMTHFAGQVTNGKSGGSGDVAAMGADMGLVLVELGGNDLCRDDVASMTSVSDYRAQFVAGLNAVKARAPEALIQVMSIPDIYNLWYIRGAAQHPSLHPEPASDQAGGINGARFYWDGLTELGVKFPCQSLLADPESWTPQDQARRAQVRQRNKDFNQVLAEECAKVLRCKFDDKQLFNWSSNRISPPDGALLPQINWNLVDGDISRNTKGGCPVTGITSGGCGDHFHPSAQGQGKIASLAYTYGRNYADTTYPTASGQVLASTRPSGLHHGRATVRFSGADNVALRGQEVRVHHPDGSTTAWSQHLGVAPDRVVDRVGTSYVEVRSLDVNGNLSTSSIVPVVVSPPLAPSAPGTPTITASATGLRVAWGAPADDGGGAISRYDLSSFAGAPPAPTGPAQQVAGTSATPPTPVPGAVMSYSVVAVNATGASASSARAATVAPFASLGAFVDRQYADFMGRAPTSTERTAAVAALGSGATTPLELVDELRSSSWFDGAYGPSIRLYQAYFLRLPDPSGLEYWVARRREGRTLAKISQQFSVSSEFVRRYGQLTNGEFIDTIYNNVFFRDPDPSGRDFYLRRLASGWSRGQVVLAFSESSEYKRQTEMVVDVIELSRGMDGKAPTDSVIQTRLIDHANGGKQLLFANLIGGSPYRTRIFG